MIAALLFLWNEFARPIRYLLSDVSIDHNSLSIICREQTVSAGQTAFTLNTMAPIDGPFFVFAQFTEVHSH